MGYLDIISLQDAKNYLRIDDTLSADDKQIEMMIEAAFEYVERWTNHIMIETIKTYDLSDYCVRVYDYPINEVLAPTEDLDVEQRGLYSLFMTTDNESVTLELNVGYKNSSDIPSGLLNAVYQIISLYYYQADNQDAGGVKLSQLATDTLNKYKRFIL